MKIILITILLTCFQLYGLNIEDGMTKIFIVSPGSKISDVLRITNEKEVPEEIKLYQTDYLFNHEGGKQYPESGTLPRSNAKFITFNPHRTIIPPETTVEIDYTIIFPDSLEDVPLTGSFWSMIMVEGISQGSIESESFDPTSEEPRMKMGISFRYAIQMITHIEDSGIRKLDFIETKIVNEEDGKSLQIDIENTGERYLNPSLSLEIYDSNGMYIKKLTSNSSRIYPQTSKRFKIKLEGIKSGKYQVLIVADAGGDDIFGINYTLDIRK